MLVIFLLYKNLSFIVKRNCKHTTDVCSSVYRIYITIFHQSVWKAMISTEIYLVMFLVVQNTQEIIFDQINLTSYFIVNFWNKNLFILITDEKQKYFTPFSRSIYPSLVYSNFFIPFFLNVLTVVMTELP